MRAQTPEPLPEWGASKAVTLSPKTFGRFADYITRELGIKMPPAKLSMVQSRLLRRSRELQLDLEAYADYFFAATSADERDHVINAITTNKTEFFREAAHFEYLTKSALPSLLEADGTRAQPVKVWSAGCSSGEEPYTLAMVLSEYRRIAPSFDYSILGTDVSTRVLGDARLGVYPEARAQGIPPALRPKYLMRSSRGASPLVRIVPELRRRVSFHRLNFMDADYRIADIFDVVFFRNVLIYFDPKTQTEVINRICRNLMPGGYLFVGHSESLAHLDVPLDPVHPSVFRKPLARRAAAHDASSLGESAHRRRLGLGPTGTAPGS